MYLSSCDLIDARFAASVRPCRPPTTPLLGGLLIASVLLKPPDTALTRRWNFTDEMFEIANRMMNSASSSVIMSA